MEYGFVGITAEMAQPGKARAWKVRGASPREFKSPSRRHSHLIVYNRSIRLLIFRTVRLFFRLRMSDIASVHRLCDA